MTKKQLDKIIAALLRLRETATDENALKSIDIYPAWKNAYGYQLNERVKYNEKLFKCITAHTSQESWTPDVAPALWTEITLEEGTFDNPIHYNGNMELFKDKYYVEDNVKYLCIRDTGIPVYNPLYSLVHIYVEIVNE